MNNKHLSLGLINFVLALGTTGTQAQEMMQELLGSQGQVLQQVDLVQAVEGAELEPGAVDAGPFDIYGAVGFESFYNDNLFLTQRDPVSTTGFVLSPGIRAELSDSIKTLGLQYAAYLGRYEHTSRSNYNNQSVLADFLYEPTDRQRLDTRAEFIVGQDPLGTGRQEGILVARGEEPDRWHAWGLGGSYGYGGTSAKGRIELDANYSQKRYINNKPATLERDLDRGDLGAAFFWRVKPKTSAVFEAVAADYAYTTATTLDSREYNLLGGVSWDVTGKTTGTAKVGWLRKTFEDPARDNLDTLNWEVGAVWQVRTYSAISFSTARSTQETNGVGDFILRTSAIAGWRHKWLGRFSTNVELGLAREEYPPTPRDDTLTDVRLGFDYRFARWLGLKWGYQYTQRDSNAPTLSYHRNLFSIGLVATLAP